MAIRIRLKVYQWLGLFLLLVIATAAVVSQAVKETCKGSHTRKDFFKSVRLLEPANVLELKGNRVNYATSSELELGSLELEDDWSIVPKDFVNKHSSCYEIFYCSKHLVVLQINELPATQCNLKRF